MNTVRPWPQPIRSAITVAGISGQCSSSSRICGSTASTIEPFGARWHFGGASSTIALRTVLLEIPSFLAIARNTGVCSAR
ncbi:hypothetical protein [Streptomyces sporangiiformans]|uniref:hypothetical protein n=1 Tax=Streptomyces sporangiiformans TaxID=2315329 RepID=UPI0013C4F809|nr:hypothetical protein [Streptomyces sporangiiformans]